MCSIFFQFSLITSVGSHGLLRQGNPEYDVKRQELYEYYHPLEFSPTLPIDEKTKLMEEWYVTVTQANLFARTLFPSLNYDY